MLYPAVAPLNNWHLPNFPAEPQPCFTVYCNLSQVFCSHNTCLASRRNQHSVHTLAFVVVYEAARSRPQLRCALTTWQHSLAVQILDAAQQLHKRQPRLAFAVAAALQHRLQQLAASHQLGDEVHLQQQGHVSSRAAERPPHAAATKAAPAPDTLQALSAPTLQRYDMPGSIQQPKIEHTAAGSYIHAIAAAAATGGSLLPHLIPFFKIFLEVDHVLVIQPAQDINFLENVLPEARERLANRHTRQ